jgi:hypothetical protein
MVVDEITLEKSFYSLYDNFLKLNLHIQQNYKNDPHMKALIAKLFYTLEDINEHYYNLQLSLVKDVKDEEENTH